MQYPKNQKVNKYDYQGTCTQSAVNNCKIIYESIWNESYSFVYGKYSDICYWKE